MAHLKTAALIAGLGFVLPAMAQDKPHMQPGLWESAIQVNGMTMGTMQLCMDGSPETLAANLRARADQRRAGRELPKADCGKPDMSAVPGGRRTEMTCTIDGHVVRTVMTQTGDTQTHMHIVGVTTRDGGAEIKNDMDLKRTGECPAGMAPGETKTQMDPNAIANMMKGFKPPVGQ